MVPGQPWRLDLTARNVTELHAWAYRITLKEWQNVGYDNTARKKLWQPALWPSATPAALRTAPDGQLAAHSVPTPPLDYQGAKAGGWPGRRCRLGYYLVVVSTQRQPPGWSRPVGAGHRDGYAAVGASELSAVYRYQPATAAGSRQLLLLHRQSGQPLAGVQAQATYTAYVPIALKPAPRPAPERGAAKRTAVGEVQKCPRPNEGWPAANSPRAKQAGKRAGVAGLPIRWLVETIGYYNRPQRR